MALIQSKQTSTYEDPRPAVSVEDPAIEKERRSPADGHVEDILTANDNLEYDLDDEEPELHARTWIALAAMFLLNMVQIVALQGPPAVLSYIAADLNNTTSYTWVSTSLTLVQAVICPMISSASDTFQARKILLVGSCILSFIGSAIAPGSGNIYRLIGAQILIGFGFAAVPLAYAVPSEILPRKWRPMAQAFCIGVAAALGAVIGPLAIGALTKADPSNGWRNFYWIQMGLWGVTALGILFGYRPPKRHTRLDHLSFWQKLACLDIIGFILLVSGLTLFLIGVSLGGSLYAWTNARVLTTIIIGGVILILFGLFEWKGTKVGFLNHELFRGGKDMGRTFALCVGLIFVEGILLFSCIIFYPLLTQILFEHDPVLLVVREEAIWITYGLSTVLWGYTSTKLKTIREPLFVGFLIFTGGIVGLATIQPGDSASAIVFAALVGLGLGAPLTLAVSGVQLSTPKTLIATATAVTTCARAVSSSIFTAIFSSAFSNRLTKKLPADIAAAALRAGLPASSLGAFVGALAGGDTAALSHIPGVTPKIIAAGAAALKKAYADSIRVVFIIAAPFGLLACVGCLFLGRLKSTMNYHVDAPVEDLHAKHDHHTHQDG